MKFNNYFLVQKISSSLYIKFILDLYIVYELNIWPRNPANNFTQKNLFGTVKLTRNTNKIKLINNGQGIAFDGKCMRSFGKGFARNVVIFCIYDTSSSHTDNQNK